MNTAFISERSPQDSGSMSTLLCLCLPRSLGISLNLNPASIFQKLIPCWLQHLQIFFFFIPQAVFSVLFMVAFALQILLSLTRSHWTQFIFVFVSMTLGDRSKNNIHLVYDLERGTMGMCGQRGSKAQEIVLDSRD